MPRINIAEDNPVMPWMRTPVEPEPVWKDGKGKLHPLSSMSDQFLQAAYKHAIKKLAFHTTSIAQHQRTALLFHQKMRELEDEANKRGMSLLDNVVQQESVQ